uniref:Uncharacterized protein n=1 Tax=Arundo donax TaxID=35708 RepID=A0A0A9Q264_ARUDO
MSHQARKGMSNFSLPQSIYYHIARSCIISVYHKANIPLTAYIIR